MNEENKKNSSQKLNSSKIEHIDLYGALKKSVVIIGDIIAPIDELWEAEN